MDKLQLFVKQHIKSGVPSLRAGDTVRVFEILKDGDKERVQMFEGPVIGTKHGSKGPSATFTVRKISGGIAVEKTYPLHSPSIQKIEIIKHDKVRRGKLYYIRHLVGKKNKKRASKMLGLVFEEKTEQTPEGQITDKEQKPEETQRKEN